MKNVQKVRAAARSLPPLELSATPLKWWQSDGGYVRHARQPEKAEPNQVVWPYEDPCELMGQPEIFLTPHEFLIPEKGRPWRNSRLLGRLHGWWVDIDAHQGPTPTLARLDYILNIVRNKIERAGFLDPNLIVRSGRGWHLYWWSDPVQAVAWRVRHWRRVAERIRDIIGDGDGWNVDASASVDVVRVLRLPGSIHAGTGRSVSAFETGARRYGYEDIARRVREPIPKHADLSEVGNVHLHGDACPACGGMLVTRISRSGMHQGARFLGCSNYPSCRHMQDGEGKLIKLPSRDQHKHCRDSERGLKETKSGHAIAGWWGRIYWGILQHVRSEWGGRVPERKRDLVLFYLCVALTHMSPSEAAVRILILGRELTDLTENEINQYMSTALIKKYKYSKPTIKNRLEAIGITLDHLQAPDYPSGAKTRLSPEQIRQAQGQGGRVSTAIRLAKRDSIMLTAIAEFEIAGQPFSVASLADRTGFSQRTVKRYLRARRASL